MLKAQRTFLKGEYSIVINLKHSIFTLVLN